MGKLCVICTKKCSNDLAAGATGSSISSSTSKGSFALLWSLDNCKGASKPLLLCVPLPITSMYCSWHVEDVFPIPGGVGLL